MTAMTVGTAMLIGSVVSVAGQALMQPDSPSMPSMPAAPEIKPPAPMPVAPGKKQKATAERSLAGLRGLSNATSILTGDDSTKLG